MLTCNYLGRFAPSPTGALHAGSLATALGSWLHARAHFGKWLVRIEDLDVPRCIPGASAIILQQLQACGLVWDDEVVYQSQRTAIYKSYLNQLIAENKAFGCQCTRKQIEDALFAQGLVRERHGELIYPGTCRNLHHTTEPCAWRLRVEDPHLRHTVGDFVLRRSDGIFTYQLAVVVDDELQGVTHIVRGEDLLDNTDRQIYLQKQLGFKTPHYMHLPLVLDHNQEKLSKQTKAQAVEVDAHEKVIKALQAAGRHLGLTEPSLFSDSSLSTAKWLEKALLNYKEHLQ